MEMTREQVKSGENVLPLEIVVLASWFNFFSGHHLSLQIILIYFYNETTVSYTSMILYVSVSVEQSYTCMQPVYFSSKSLEFDHKLKDLKKNVFTFNEFVPFMWYTNVSFSFTVPLPGHYFCTVPRSFRTLPPAVGQVLVLALTLVSFFQLFAGYLELSCISRCVFFVL